MTSDESHEQYYKKNLNGNHIEPSPATLVKFAELEGKINNKKLEIEYLKKELQENRDFIKALGTVVEKQADIFVLFKEFIPVRRIVFGTVGTIMVAFLGAVTALILK